MLGQPDVFISYAHEYSEFAKELEQSIKKYGEQLLKRDVPLKIWTDKQILTGQRWEEVLLNRISQSRVFVPIVAPKWLTSVWCNREIRERWDLIQKGLRRANQTCILPIFHLVDDVEKKQFTDVYPMQVNHDFPSLKPRDWDFDPFARELAQVLKILYAKEENIPDSKARGTVFLGHAFSREMNGWRNQVAQSLRSNNYNVKQVTLDESGDPAKVGDDCDKAIESCIAAIHFVDEDPLPRNLADDFPWPIETQRSAVDNAKERGLVRPGFFELYWSGPDNSPDRWARGREYSKYVLALKDLHFESVTEFGRIVVHKLNEPPPPPKVTEERPEVCFIFDNKDSAQARLFYEYCAHANRNWKVVPEPGQSVEDDLFGRYRNFLVYWGYAPAAFYEMNFTKLNDARQLIDDPELKEPAAVALYVGPDYMAMKADLERHLPKSFRYKVIQAGSLDEHPTPAKIDAGLRPFAALVK